MAEPEGPKVADIVTRALNAAWIRPFLFLIFIVVLWDLTIRVFRIPPYQIPAPVRAPLTLDSSFADLADEPATMALVTAAIRKRAPELASAMESGQGRSGMTLRRMLAIIPNSSTVEREIEAALAEQD